MHVYPSWNEEQKDWKGLFHWSTTSGSLMD